MQQFIINLQVHMSGAHCDMELRNYHNDGKVLVGVDVRGLAQRIRNMRTLCIDHDLAVVVDWCDSPVWEELFFNGERVRSTTGKLYVNKQVFWFECYIKPTSILLSTACTEMSVLKRMGV